MNRLVRWTPLVLIAIVLTIATTGHTAANTIGVTKVEDDTRAITADGLKPTECAGIVVTAKRSGSGNINGNANAELITGSAAVDTISGQGGSDCILGGASNDSLNGGSGVDVCIGGAGTDTFNANCETQIQ